MNGTATHVCRLCGEQETKSIPSIGHTPVIDKAVAPTCTETGLTAGKKCSVCGEILVAQEVIPATGHAYVTVDGKAPTCTETGLTKGTYCETCQEILTVQEVIPALGHTEVILPGVEPTCIESGLTEGKKCSACGEILVEQKVIPALGHTEEIIPGVEPTKTETGLTEGVKCSVCGEILIAQKIIPTLGGGSSGSNPNADVWDGSIATGFAGGSGTQNDPYLISTGAQLAYLASSVNAGNTCYGYYFKLVNDIDLNQLEWTPIGRGILAAYASTSVCFSGHFDGNGCRIWNLWIHNTSTSFSGLFGVVTGSISRIGLCNVTISTSISKESYAGSIAGYLQGGSISECFAENVDMQCKGSIAAFSGGIVGLTDYGTVVENCYAIGKISGNGYTGGICGAGYNAGRVTKCYYIGELYNSGSVGSGKIPTQIGGIGNPMGYTASGIENSFFVGTMSSAVHMGPISGDNRGYVENCYYMSSGNFDRRNGNSTSVANLQSQSWLSSTLGWDFSSVWAVEKDHDYPVLKAFAHDQGEHTHTEEIIPGVEPTCTESGLTEGKKCSACGEILVEQKVIFALGHFEEIIPGVEPTKTEEGLTEGVKCSVCGKILVDQEIIPALGGGETVVDVWDGSIATGFAGGSGTESDPYLISTGAQLAFLARAINSSNNKKSNTYYNKYYKLTNSIDLNGLEWDPIGCYYWDSYNSVKYCAFQGNFNGNDYEVSNFKITTPEPRKSYYRYFGLFGYVNGKIENLGVVNFEIDITKSEGINIGGLVGYVSSDGMVSNSYATGKISVASISNSGGLVGFNHGTIANSYATGEVSATAGGSLGGLVGGNTGMITSSYATSNVQADIKGNGGRIRAGGLVGSIEVGSIENSYASGDIHIMSNSSYKSDYVYAGGVVGYYSSSWHISNCHATGDVSAVSFGSYAYAGGLVGGYFTNYGIIECFAAGNVSAVSTRENAYAGGLVGDSDGWISCCYAMGNVSASPEYSNAYAGGLVGYTNNGSAYSSYATGDVSVSSLENAYAGGLFGYYYNSYGNSIRASYAIGNVNATASQKAYAGGLVGNNPGTITNSYCYEDQIIIMNDKAGASNTLGTPCTLTDLNSPSFYTDTLGWDSSIWILSNLDFASGKYPKLFNETVGGETEHTHTEEIIPGVEPTCTESGLTEGKKCSACGEILVEQKVIFALGHFEEIIPGVEPTKTEEGLTEGVKCSVCGEILVAQEIIPALGGIEAYENSVLQAIQAPIGEYVTIQGIVGPSLVNKPGFYLIDETGVIAVITDYTTLETLSLGNKILITGTKNVVTKDGNKFHGQTKIDLLEIVENDGGSHEYSTNSFITGKTFADICALNALEDHTTGAYLVTATVNWIITQYYTTVELTDGTNTMRLYCSSGKQYAFLEAFSGQEVTLELSLCNWSSKAYYNGCVLAVYTDGGKIVNKLNFPEKHEHAFEVYPAVPPTCTESGLTEGKKCSTCGEILIQQDVIPALGHVEEIIPGVEPTCTTEGMQDGIYCSRCEQVLQEQTVLPALGHNLVNCVCTLCGYEIRYSEGLSYVSNGDGTCYVSGIGSCTDTDVIIPSIYNGERVTSIGNRAFYRCIGLTSIEIPDSVTSIGNQAFENCTGLTSVVISDGVTSIGDQAFYYCTGLTFIEIPDSVTSIGGAVFYGCYHLTSIVIPDSVMSIRGSMFYGCTDLTSVVIGNSVTSIGGYAFNGCTDLTSVVIGNSVTSIGDYAFYGCTGLASITFEGTTAQWNAITKRSFWRYSVPATQVICSDGTVSLN